MNAWNILVSFVLFFIMVGVVSVMVAGAFLLFGAPALMAQGVAYGVGVACIIGALGSVFSDR